MSRRGILVAAQLIGLGLGLAAVVGTTSGCGGEAGGKGGFSQEFEKPTTPPARTEGHRQARPSRYGQPGREAGEAARQGLRRPPAARRSAYPCFRRDPETPPNAPGGWVR